MKPVLGYTAAALTIVAAVLVPFLLIELFTKGVAATGVRVDPIYGGGEPDRVIERGAYRVTIYKPVRPGGLVSRERSYVQLAWSPAAALPGEVAEEIDLDQDGRPDALVRFKVPRDPQAALRVDVIPRSGLVREMRQVGRGSFSSLIVRMEDRVVVRVPLEK